MRSFFKRPSWANTGDGETPHEFYRRADQTYEDIVAASREARIRSINLDCASSPQDRKASRSQYMSDNDHPGDVAFSISPENNQVANRQVNEPIPGVTSQSESSEDKARRSSSIKVPRPSDMRVTAILSTETAKTPRNQTPPQGPCAVDTPVRSPSNTWQDESLARHTHEHEQDSEDDCSPQFDINTGQRHEDSTVQILVSSNIANTKSLVIKRKMHQPLKDVRLAWCEHQNLPQELYRFVLLTWKGRRLFDVTTCKSLGRHANTDLRTSTFRDAHLDDCGGIYIHMEAVMDDRVSNDSLASLRLLPGQHLKDPPNLDDTIECRSFKLVLKCPGYANYQIYASPQTPISQLVAAYRDTHAIRAEQNVYLIFDGDCLDPHSCAADHDMTDDDLVDVIIK
ncbi:hypothetical protein P170DRAFT_511661 [Aspergillus steynii IBT 23096]|uniref:Ubiquitin-like domain-containing protein n=1 Tax=Aspergillus steynii IBT 23096 TaxID=1392250 RepID=A0A2I2G287_9EURO|nr:uncharacterized protein P170DRAFT_511661 [Aspergillus steynii IBT 23096]PLB47002.1 hypothetical protein P170DRAFT_511661 [Aspergillus steynii IBT 23096]